MNCPISATEAAQSATLLRIIRRMTEAGDVPHLAAALEHAIREVTGAEAATFVLRRHDLTTDAAGPATLADASTQHLRFAIELSGTVFGRGEAVVIEDASQAAQMWRGSPRVILTGSVAAVPVGRVTVTGAVVAYWSAPLAAGAHFEVLSALADTAGLTLEKIQLLERLRESDGRFRLMADTSPVMIWVTDAAGSIEFVNRTYCDFFGVKEADVQGPGGWQPLVHPDDIGHYVDGFLQSLRAGTSFFAEARVRRADGQWRWIASYAAPRLSTDGRILGAVGSSPDITELKAAELALEISEQRLHTIVDSTPALVYVVDVDHNFVLINRQFGRVFDIDPRSVRGKSLYDYFPRETADQFATHNRQVISGGTPSEFEEVVQHQDGPHYYVSMKAPMFDEANRPVSICGVSTDITQQKRLLSALELANREKDAFVATVAHELRQPLGAIQAALSVMRMRPDRAVEERAHQTVERQMAQLTRLVDDLLDAARIAQGKAALRPERVTLNSVLDGALAVVRPAVQRAGQHLDVSIPSGPVWVHGDATRLQQVFSNLLTNASKFTEEGGCISLGVDAMPNAAVVRVTDNGRGIAADVLPRIFDLFTQAGVDGRGLGIGLSVVRALVLPAATVLEQISDVIPFNTNAGSRGSSFRMVRELCSRCTVLEGFVTRGGVERNGQHFVIRGSRADEVRTAVRS